MILGLFGHVVSMFQHAAVICPCGAVLLVQYCARAENAIQ